MTHFSPGFIAALAEYNIANAALLTGTATSSLSWTPGVGPTSTTTVTIVGWFFFNDAAVGTTQRLFTSDSGTEVISAFIDTNEKLNLQMNLVSATYTLTTDRVFRDTIGWVPILFEIDTAQATQTDRAAIYIGEDKASVTGTYPATQNEAISWGESGTEHNIGRYNAATAQYADIYVAEFYSIDGQALTPSDFGEADTNTGNWVAKKYTGTYGTNSFYLDFSNVANLGEDQSGNGNDWTENGTITQVTSTPTNVAATLNPLLNHGGLTFSNGNLSVASTTAAWRTTVSTISMSEGKWSMEVTIDNVGSGAMLGIANIRANLASNDYPGIDTDSWGYFSTDGNKYINNVSSAYGNSYTTSDVIRIEFDADSGDLYLFKNDVVQNSGTPLATGLTSGPYVFAVASSNGSLTAAFTEADFIDTPSAGFLALTTDNLPALTIKNVEDVHLTVLDTGANIEASVASAISAAGWGSDAYRVIYRNRANTANQLLIFSDDATNSFKLDDPALGKVAMITLPAGDNHIAWVERLTTAYDAGTGEISHTNGAATTVTHNLGSTDVVIEMWDANNGDRRNVYHPALTAGSLCYWDGTDVETADTAITNITANSFDIDSGEATGTKRWCVRASNDVRKYDSYTGNVSADGPNRNVMLSPVVQIDKKFSGGVGGWLTVSAAVSTYNPVDKFLRYEVSTAEATFTSMDFSATGSKLYTNTGEWNGADEFLTITWGQPTGGSNVAPANGR